MAKAPNPAACFGPHAWEAPGLVPMDSGESSADGGDTNTSSMGGFSGISIGGRSQESWSSGSTATLSASGLESTDSDTDESQFSTDVSETVEKEHNAGEKARPDLALQQPTREL
eukprot:CAMPEP_0174346878 /NCGR_PEP_ID=MMETSP0811_2-20130205/2798_1 /TAXON_ID=73025 ORGANISM="Eutreptiella gymnastica-like, Strain CCMP1594" /NCGR_SAMPLE_ID=MMETSP0811_2 /ASSEMBLY_ACC=CAM_ASM_000667 /LENGTH=113 /DNA_ID=CAMNT_0015471915 /DNA_START=92 /DNA_END=434 /DNA_ORIENTATION=+